MSFQQGLSGLNASSKNLEVIGNNVANANTFGAKSSRAEFADMYATAMSGGGSNNIGIGVNMAAVTQQFTQGNITTTANSLDLAINGSGFFEVAASDGQTQYSRNGQFQVNKEGFIQNNGGLKLLGYPADNQGVIQPGLAVPLQIPTAGIDPNRTSEITLEMNLDSRAGATLPAAAPLVDFSDATTYNNATSVTVYDDIGQDVALTYYFQKADTNTWNVYVTANGTSVNTDAAGDPAPLTTIIFPPNGGTPQSPAGPINLDIPASVNAAGAVTLAIPGIELDISGATQYGASFGVTNLAQDGYAPGQLAGLSIEKTGIVMATYSNGQSQPAGQIELATFRNVQGLKPLGGNLWARTFESGDPVVGTPGQGNLGVLQSGALEESNVDLTAELVNMMTAQRVYQANAQTIKTQDQVMQTLVNLR
ncbi:MAG: flagellar biosynthesis protein FlgE [Pseudomonadota bacterium]|jgi:flagellar hook protein FlgE